MKHQHHRPTLNHRSFCSSHGWKFAAVLACVIVSLSATPVHGQLAYERLKSFGIPELAAIAPTGLIEGMDGKLYGTAATAGGGPLYFGTVFRVNKDGSGYMTLHSFNNSDGAFPGAGVVEGSDGKLYGTTPQGGEMGFGVIFRLNKDGSGFAVLRSFDFPDGIFPNGVTEAGDGRLYGTASQGGDSGRGTVFSLNKDGSGYTVLHSFIDSDGIFPYAGVVEASDGNLYGTSNAGGDSGFGTVFRLNKGGTGYTVLHSFSGPDGAGPTASIFEAGDGRLYGTASAGGDSGLGTVFKLNKDGSEYAVLHSFSGPDGASPYSGVSEGGDGNVYGTTFQGGDAGSGTVFKASTDGSNFALLHSFSGSDGASPFTGVVKASDDILYGTTRESPAGNNGGRIYKLNKDGNSFATIWTFNPSGGDGLYLYARAREASDGNLYGTTVAGGNFTSGIAYKLNKGGTGYTVLHNFAGADGANPFGELVELSDGRLYGTTAAGGAFGAGTAYRLRKDGTEYTVLHSFNNSDGASPIGGVVETSDGKLYGTASFGGDTGSGTVFRMNKDGTGYTVLHSFTFADGAYPEDPLLVASDGKLYGTTLYGGDSGSGTVFGLNRDGSGYAIIHSCSDPDGTFPFAGVVESSDGRLYGTAVGGGDAGGGVVFGLNKDGSLYSIVHSFNSYVYVAGGVIEASDGLLYGTTSQGPGDSFFGMIFSLNKSGSNYNILHSFGGSDGSRPVAGLMEASDGELYGTTGGGGIMDIGVIYRLVWTNTPNAAVSGSVSLPLAPGINAIFSLTVSVTKMGKPSGIVAYQDQNSRISFKSTALTTVSVVGTHGRILGKGTINGTGSYDFVVNVDDLAAPGAFKDKFSIKLSNGYKAGGTVGAKSEISIGIRK